MERIGRTLAIIEDKALCVTLLCVCMITLLQILTRVVPFLPTPTWTEELARYFFMWMVFLGVSCNIRKKDHIKADFLVKRFLDPGPGSLFAVFQNCIIMLFSIVVIVKGCQLCLLEFKTQRMLISLSIPIYAVSLIIPLSFAFSGFHLTYDILSRKKETDK